MPARVHLHAKADLAKAVAEYVGPLAQAAIATTGRFTVALSGGSMPNMLGADGGLR
jgi:6-phosphogluconolactonase/glucosamine-6-phosphate isomerase/deaminase